MIVWFIYPETANVRLEDMNSIFGDASTAAPTPAMEAEAESLFSRDSRSNRSPSSSFRLAQNDEQVPDMDLQPPDVKIQDGKPVLSSDAGSDTEGVGGWISKIAKKAKGEEDGGKGRYGRVAGQEEDER